MSSDGKYILFKTSCVLCRAEVTHNNLGIHYGSKMCRKGGKATTINKNKVARVSLNCEYCDKLCKSVSSVIGHETYCTKNTKQDAKKVSHRKGIRYTAKIIDSVECSFCSKIYRTASGIKNHEIRCPKNPNQQIQTISEKGKENSKKLYAEFCSTYWANEDNRVKRSLQMAKVVEDNPESYITGQSTWRVKRLYYNDNIFAGQWELDFYKWCELNNIMVKKYKGWYKYYYEGKIHRYNPDFYLPQHGIYIEVKGAKSDKDDCKWESLVNIHAKRLVIVDIRSIEQIKQNTITLDELLKYEYK